MIKQFGRFTPWLPKTKFSIATSSNRSAFISTRHHDNMNDFKEPMSIFFVRHSESEENTRVAAWKKTFRGQQHRLTFGEMLSVIKPSMRDAPVTERGHQMIETVKQKLTRNNFFEQNKIEAWLCSPLQRTVQTCRGLWDECDIEQHPCLLERQPLEFVVPITFNRRVDAFTRLLCSRKEQTIAVVGHCRFFMAFLGIE